MDYWKDVPGIDEGRDRFDMKKAKKFIFQAHQKLGEAIHLIDSNANPSISNALLKLQDQIAKINSNIN